MHRCRRAELALSKVGVKMHKFGHPTLEPSSRIVRSRKRRFSYVLEPIDSAISSIKAAAQLYPGCEIFNLKLCAYVHPLGTFQLY